MSNFELIDDYLTDRLDGSERESFERQLQSDPSLKADVDFQKHVLEGIRGARALELKSMLNNVPVGSGITIDFPVARIAAGLVGAGVVFASVYFFMKPNGPSMKDASADINPKKEQVAVTPEPRKVEEPVKEEPALVVAPNENTASKPVVKKSDKSSAVKDVKQPKLNVLDPTDDLNSSENTPVVPKTGSTDLVVPSNVEVTIDTENKKYALHYQFTKGKLYLYGPFDRGLYEILEINGETHSVFLFYKDSYYMLDENQQHITKLEPIKDAELVKKLKEYRGK